MTISKPEWYFEQVSAEITYAIRQEILRPGKPQSSCHFSDDTATTTFHLGCYIENSLLGVASFYKNQLPGFRGTHFQLRGMAVKKRNQSNGIGKSLLLQGETIAKTHLANLLWCNARISAVGFYSNQGYLSYGTPFDVPEIGPHVVMYKNLQNTNGL